MKKLLASSLVALAAPLALVTPAGAAVPSKPAKETRPCREGQGVARLWYTVSKGKLTKLAIDNPCAEYLVFSHVGDRDGAWKWQAAPGSHFNWAKKRIVQYGVADLALTFGFTAHECGDPNDTVRVVWRYNDVRDPVDPNGDAC